MSRRAIVALLVGLLVLIFALQNIDMIELHFLRWDLSVKSGYAVGVPFLLGVFVGLLLQRRYQRKIQKMQQMPEPGSPAALLANANVAGKKKAASWWW